MSLHDPYTFARIVRGMIDIQKWEGWLPECRGATLQQWVQGGSSMSFIFQQALHCPLTQPLQMLTLSYPSSSSNITNILTPSTYPRRIFIQLSSLMQRSNRQIMTSRADRRKPGRSLVIFLQTSGVEVDQTPDTSRVL